MQGLSKNVFRFNYFPILKEQPTDSFKCNKVTRGQTKRIVVAAGSFIILERQSGTQIINKTFSIKEYLLKALKALPDID